MICNFAILIKCILLLHLRAWAAHFLYPPTLILRTPTPTPTFIYQTPTPTSTFIGSLVASCGLYVSFYLYTSPFTLYTILKLVSNGFKSITFPIR